MTLCPLAGLMAELQWPVEDHIPYQISSTFGESRIDHFHNGLDIPGKNLKIRPLKKGRLSWYKKTVTRSGELPFGGGKTVVLDHGDIQTGYMHLTTINEKLIQSKTVSNDKYLGTSGNTGHSGGAHIHFFLYSPEKKKFFNPLSQLSNLHYKDEKPPEVRGFAVKLPDSIEQVNLTRPLVMSKEFPLYAQLVDRGLFSERWGVYELSVFHKSSSEKPLFHIVFDTLHFSKNRWRASNGKTFDQVYYQNWYYLGRGFKASRELKWKARGYSGPSSEFNYSLNIRDR